MFLGLFDRTLYLFAEQPIFISWFNILWCGAVCGSAAGEGWSRRFRVWCQRRLTRTWWLLSDHAFCTWVGWTWRQSCVRCAEWKPAAGKLRKGNILCDTVNKHLWMCGYYHVTCTLENIFYLLQSKHTFSSICPVQGRGGLEPKPAGKSTPTANLGLYMLLDCLRR